MLPNSTIEKMFFTFLNNLEFENILDIYNFRFQYDIGTSIVYTKLSYKDKLFLSCY